MKENAKKDAMSIVQDGNPVLRAIAKPVAKSDFGSKNLRNVIDFSKSAQCSHRRHALDILNCLSYAE